MNDEYVNKNNLDGITTLIEHLPNALKLARQNAGLTLKNVAHLSGLSHSFISDIERGARSPSLNTLHKLASAYQRTITVDIPFKTSDT